MDTKVDRMHIPKVRAMEEVGWYRENSVRFVRLFKPRSLFSFFVTMVAIPVFVVNLCVASKVRTALSAPDSARNTNTAQRESTT